MAKRPRVGRPRQGGTLLADEPNQTHRGEDMNTETWHVELTDTFGGEANYGWVERYTLHLPEGSSQRKVLRAAKKEAGLTGLRGVTEGYGDMYAFRPRDMNVVMFVTTWDGSTWNDEESEA